MGKMHMSLHSFLEISGMISGKFLTLIIATIESVSELACAIIITIIIIILALAALNIIWSGM